MVPKSVVEDTLGREILITVPTIEGGIFSQNVGLDKARVFGGIALITGVSKEDTERIKAGDPEVLESYIVYDDQEAGLMHFTKCRAALLIGSRATHELSKEAVINQALYSMGWLKEYSPYKYQTATSPLHGPLSSIDSR